MSWQPKLINFVASRAFFICILVVFVIESVWLAISAAYPGVFDENTHFGIIQLYSHQWSPLFLHQPSNAGFAGAITRDPSYLYRYLLSFPYRLTTVFTNSQTAQIIVLRLINIGFFAASLVLFRKLLLKTRASAAVVHVVLGFFILLPVVPLLASEINYDNLVMPLAALVLLLTVSIRDQLAAGKLPLTLLCWTATLCLLGSLVQFEFLPIFMAIVLYVAWTGWQAARKGKLSLAKAFGRASKRLRGWHLAGVVLPLVIATGLFLQMYGVNIVRYHTPTPQCSQVLTVTQCEQYGPWERDHIALEHKQAVSKNPVRYSVSWSYRMLVELFYTSSGGASPQAWYLSINPLPVPFIGAGVLLLFGLILVACYWRKLLRTYNYLGFFAFVAIFYAVLLLMRNYADYLMVGQKIAINGRYILPVLPPVLLIVALGYREFLSRFKRGVAIGFVVVVLLIFTQGGGSLAYITASNDYWYWPGSSLALKLNHAAKHITNHMVIFKKPLPPVGL